MAKSFDRKAHCRRIAALGGKAVVAKHGQSHMSAIGVKGFRATSSKFRSVAEYKDYLRRLGIWSYVTSTGLPDTGKFDHSKPTAPWESNHVEF